MKGGVLVGAFVLAQPEEVEHDLEAAIGERRPASAVQV